MGLFIFNNPVGRKFIMAISGLGLVLFLLFHATMNIFVVINPDVYDLICDFLGANWYSLIGTAALALLFVIHIVYAFVLTLQNYKARGTERYAVSKKAPGIEWASQNMLVLGIIVLVGLGLHLFNFWYKMQYVQILGNEAEDGAELVSGLFSNSLYCLLYIVWFIAIWFHLTHGFWSALHTVGWNSNKWLSRLQIISNVYATIVMLMFLFVPVYFLITNLFA